jgi:xanthine dehydrogenase accessory factor
MDDWPLHGLEDDLRPRMATLAARDEPFALVTIEAAEGGPRKAGAQMLVSSDDSWGFLSGGCIEADVALHARETLSSGDPRRLVYGRGSPWIDTRLPCGGRLDLLVERIAPDDSVIAALIAARNTRAPLRYRTDGKARACVADGTEPDARWPIDRLFSPPQRLVVFGSDPLALAVGGLGAAIGWETTIVWPSGPEAAPAMDVAYRRDSPGAALDAIRPDPWTAVIVATHDEENDERAILATLATDAAYVGVIGARRRVNGRLERLKGHGVMEPDLARLRMPTGLAIGAATPWEIAVSVAAQIIAEKRALPEGRP